jgi:hypothetical protein
MLQERPVRLSNTLTYLFVLHGIGKQRWRAQYILSRE